MNVRIRSRLMASTNCDEGVRRACPLCCPVFLLLTGLLVFETALVPGVSGSLGARATERTGLKASGEITHALKPKGPAQI
jgi:hypothetical protein